ncbi:MAG: beta-propeller fold lactonase family protein [Thermoplasmata archaeon]
MKRVGVALLVAVVALAIVALPLAGASSAGADHNPIAAVFVSTNNATHNQIVAYERSSGGKLTWVADYSTGGAGTGATLADSGSLALTQDHHWLLAVDAGSNQISVFQVAAHAGGALLALTDVTGSGGILPVSIAVSGNIVYVLNDGSSISAGNIAGFTLTSGGHLFPLAGATQPLSTSSPTGAAQVSFSPTGGLLVVTEKNTNVIDVYTVNRHGIASGPTSYSSAGVTPYGFAFAGSHHLVVSEAHSPSVSSFSLSRSAGLRVVTNSISDLQNAPCWVVVTAGGNLAFISNTASDTLSSFVVSNGGKLTLLQTVAAPTAAGPADSAIAGQTNFLYVYGGGAGELQGFHVNADGALTWIQTVGGLPVGAEGLVAI